MPLVSIIFVLLRVCSLHSFLTCLNRTAPSKVANISVNWHKNCQFVLFYKYSLFPCLEPACGFCINPKIAELCFTGLCFDPATSVGLKTRFGVMFQLVMKVIHYYGNTGFIESVQLLIWKSTTPTISTLYLRQQNRGKLPKAFEKV